MITYGVERLSTVAILQICALLKLVVANLAHIVVAVRFIAMHLLKLTAEIVREVIFSSFGQIISNP